jgi:hypothetical protein
LFARGNIYGRASDARNCGAAVRSNLFAHIQTLGGYKMKDVTGSQQVDSGIREITIDEVNYVSGAGPKQAAGAAGLAAAIGAAAYGSSWGAMAVGAAVAAAPVAAIAMVALAGFGGYCLLRSPSWMDF